MTVTMLTNPLTPAANNNGAPIADTARPTTNAEFVPPAYGTEQYFTLMAYNEWLCMERRILGHLMGWGSAIMHTPANDFHIPNGNNNWTDVATPATRALPVMKLVGVDVDAVHAWAREEVDAERKRVEAGQ